MGRVQPRPCRPITSVIAAKVIFFDITKTHQPVIGTSRADPVDITSSMLSLMDPVAEALLAAIGAWERQRVSLEQLVRLSNDQYQGASSSMLRSIEERIRAKVNDSRTNDRLEWATPGTQRTRLDEFVALLAQNHRLFQYCRIQYQRATSLDSHTTGDLVSQKVNGHVSCLLVLERLRTRTYLYALDTS